MDAKLVEKLNAFSAFDLADIFVSEHVKADQLLNLNVEDLKKLGVSLERAQRFLNDIQKDQEKKETLFEKLKEANCEEIFDNLAKAGCTSEEVLSLDDEALRKMGIGFKKRKQVLTRIKKMSDAKCKYQT